MKEKIYLLIIIASIILITEACSEFLSLGETQREGPRDLGNPVIHRRNVMPNDVQLNNVQVSITQAASVLLGAQKASIFGSESWKDPIGFQVGAIVPVMDIGESLSLEVEANLSLQGARWEYTDLEGRTNLLYVNVPLFVKYRTKSGFFGEAGLQPGLLLSARDKYEDTNEDYMDHMNRFDLSLPLGFGYEFKNNFGVGLRVIPGLTDITKDEDEKDSNFVVVLRGIYTFKKK